MRFSYKFDFETPVLISEKGFAKNDKAGVARLSCQKRQFRKKYLREGFIGDF
jgi:hypothetical protein